MLPDFPRLQITLSQAEVDAWNAAVETLLNEFAARMNVAERRVEDLVAANILMGQRLDDQNARDGRIEVRVTNVESRVTRLEGNPTTPTPTDPVPTDPKPTDPVPPAITNYILYVPSKIKTLPTSGAAWDRLAAMAKRTWSRPDLGDNNSQGDAEAVAGALYAVRMNDAAMKAKVIAHLKLAITSRLTRTLELGRGLLGYVIAAQLIDYADPAFVDWVYKMVVHVFDKGDTHSGLQTILVTATTLNSNWATQCRRSVVGAAIYLKEVGTPTQKSAAAEWLRLGVLSHLRDIGAQGDFSSLPAFKSAPTGWYGNSNPIVGINRPGTTQLIDGKVRNLDGVRGSDWLRAKRTSDGAEDREARQWPPNPVTYHWEGLEPQIVLGMILHQQGIVDFNAGDHALVRATRALYGLVPNDPPFFNPASGDDRGCIWIVRQFGGLNIPVLPDEMPDKAGVGWMDWYLG